jgi:hypothetical protein
MFCTREQKAMSHPATSLRRFRMKEQTRSNQRQAELFGEPQPNKNSTPCKLPADQSQKLEVALGDLLLDAVTKIKRGEGGDRDA